MESESNTSSGDSDDSDNNYTLLLTSSNYDDLEESIFILLTDIITENPLLYSKNDFHDIIKDDIMNYFIQNFIDGTIIKNIYDFNKMQHIITNIVSSFFMNNPITFPLRSQYETNVLSNMETS